MRRAVFNPLELCCRTFSISSSHLQKRPSIPISGPRTTPNFPLEGGSDPKEFLSQLDVFSGLPTPPSAVDSVFPDGFLLNDGQMIRGDGVFLLSNDVLRWRALLSEGELEEAEAKAKKTSVLELPDESWGLLDVIYPKPGIVPTLPKFGESIACFFANSIFFFWPLDLLIIGTGYRTLLLHPKNKGRIRDMGINVDVMDTHNAAAEYNLLATERPGSQVAAALLLAGFGRTIEP